MSLHETTSRAEALSTRCAATPGMNSFQPIAASALEACRAANLVGNQTTRKLAVNETDRMINGMATAVLPLLDDTRNLKQIEAKLHEIRRANEHMPVRSRTGKLMRNAFDRETSRLEKELKALVDALLKGTYTFPSAESKKAAATELANAPPVFSETAQTAKSNRATALQLAAHPSMVTGSIVERAATLGLDEPEVPNHSESLVALTSILSDIHVYLIMVNKVKDRIAEFDWKLHKALEFTVHFSSILDL
ncbi:hypothetical protein MSAN_00337900 [Mycena sanguinolenta]|uniref:Uncharacterized protein n=1 Tax=Mycena sanguinolenta TaxID=230812 RepID=A0A8H7DJF6_9AGAR|nr:hypothetical protein MSAN_00337900 [Mycena sanguinolenta]